LINQKNSIEIDVDTRLDSKKTIPHQFQPDGVNNTAGIFRSIYFLGIPEHSIEEVAHDYRFTPDLSQCELIVNFDLKDRINNTLDPAYQNKKPGYLQYYIELLPQEGDRPIFQERKDIDVQNYTLTRNISTKLLIEQPQLWSPETPVLYLFRIKLISGGRIIDQFEQSLGLKQIIFRDGNIYLNGNRYILKGVNWAENYLVDGALLERNQLLKDLELVKQLNANAIRVLHHPAHPILTGLCDSLGLFLLQEIPLDWMPTSRFASENFLGFCSDYLYEVVNRDRNHVSVFAWGVGGHFQLPGSSVKNFTHQMTERLTDLTNIPFYTWESVGAAGDSNLIPGISLVNLNKQQIQNELVKRVKKNNHSISLVLSFGAPQLGVATDNDNYALFEEYQVLQIVDKWRAITSFPEIDGFFITSLSDYQGNYSSIVFRNCVNSNLRPFGLTDYHRKKRVGFETVRSLYQEGESSYKSGVDMKDSFPATFPIVGLAMILVFLFMVNSRRYFRENFKRIFVHPHGFYVDIRDGRKVPPSHTIFMALFISIGCGLMCASLLSFFKYNPPIDHLLTILSRTSELKKLICYLGWKPEWSVLFFSLLSLFLFFMMALYFKFMALVSRKRCSITQCFTITFWLAGNLLIFIPLGMILFRLFQYENAIIPIFIFVIIIIGWFIVRVFKGMRVMFVWTIHRSFIVLLFTIAAIFGSILYYYQAQYSLIDYLKFYNQIYGAQIFTSHLY